MPLSNKKFSTLIKEVRIKPGFSQEDLARALGVCFANVNRWKNGKTSPSKVAYAQFDLYCQNMKENGLQLSEVIHDRVPPKIYNNQ